MEEEKTNWGQAGYLIIAFSGVFLVWVFFLEAPRYDSLERVYGNLDKYKIVRTPQGVGTRWLYLSVGDEHVSACMPQLGNSSSINKPGKEIWILGVPDYPCDFQIWEIGSGNETIVSYNSIVSRSNEIGRKIKLILWPVFVAGVLLVLFWRLRFNKSK